MLNAAYSFFIVMLILDNPEFLPLGVILQSGILYSVILLIAAIPIVVLMIVILLIVV